jgi:hypothetical protein
MGRAAGSMEAQLARKGALGLGGEEFALLVMVIENASWLPWDAIL